MPDIETPQGGDSIRDDIVAATKELEAKAVPPPEPEKAAQPPSEPEKPVPEVKPETITGDRPRDEKGRYVKQGELPLEAEKKAEAEKPPEPAPKPAAEVPKTEPKGVPAPIPEHRAPQSWKPVAREDWAKIPPAAQAEIVRLENETKRVIRESSEARQGYQRFREVVSPFEAMIRSEGAEPVQAVQTLLNTAYALRTAPVPQKAAILADLVRTYLPGVEGLQLLDQTLAGSPPTQTGVQQQVMRDPRLDQLLSEIEQAKTQMATQWDTRAAEILAPVEQQEFYEDVRMDMADIMDLYAKRGLQMDPMEAYNRAVALNPDVAKVVEQRKAAQAASQNGPTQRAKDAASSVKSTPAAGVRAPSQGGTLREDLEEVVKELSSNRGV